MSEICVDFLPGEIHAVLGENGAGKSTLMGVLAGFVAPDGGVVTLNGQVLPFGAPPACRNLGIELVHQHFMLVPAFTVEENLRLARLRRPAGNASTVADRLGWTLDGNRHVQDLSVGERQRLEILKVLETYAKVLIFDEPTAVLSADEVEQFFALLRGLRAEGKTLILIAHKLSEVLSIADRVTVLRRGAKVAEAPRSEVDAPQLAQWMVGDLPKPKSRGEGELGEIVLQASDLVVRGDRDEESVRGVSLEIRRREIVGIGGVDGNGQTELAEAIAQVRLLRSGSLEAPANIGYIPQDRQIDGLALNMPIWENLLIGGYRRPELTKGPMLRLKAIRSWASRLVQQFDIRIGRISDPVGSLSGGNQQKVVVSRTLDANPDLVVAVNPTRGLDIRSAGFVHDQLRAAADRGAGVLLVSTDLDELFELSDRAFFMSSGKLVEANAAVNLVGGQR